jgi:hypothetical protein
MIYIFFPGKKISIKLTNSPVILTMQAYTTIQQLFHTRPEIRCDNDSYMYQIFPPAASTHDIIITINTASIHLTKPE